MFRYLLVFVLALCAQFAQAQTGFHVGELALENPNPDPNEIEQILATHVKNTSNASTLYRWVRTTVCTTPEYGNSVCIGANCFEQTENTRTFTLDAGDSTELSMHLWRNLPDGNPFSTIEVELFPDATPANTVTVRFTYGVCTSITSEPGAYPSLEVFPNPTTQFVTISDFADATRVEMYDLSGALVRTHDLATSAQIDVADLAQGTFILRVTNQDRSRKQLLSFVKQ
jgi:Secretion system C-terminal sorting domain